MSSPPFSRGHLQIEPWSRPNAQVRPDAMIAVMGSTGTGKSTFIRLVTRDERIKVGYTLESETADVKTASFFEADGRAVTFIDTPGFDDSRDGGTDTDILKKISSYLKTEHDEGRKLNGLIYMHRINDVRIGGVSKRNLRMFQKLCGSTTLQNVVIVTTMWDTVSEELGAQRERELMVKTFKPLLDDGAQMKRFNSGLTSATEIISYILFHDPIVLQIQEELAAGKELSQTAAGEELNAGMKRLIEKRQRDMQALREEFEMSLKTRDAQAQKEIADEREKMQAEIRKWQDAVTDLNRGLEPDKTKAVQDRRAAEIDKEKQRAEFLEQIAVERSRWETAAKETAERNQLNEQQLRAQLDVQIKEAHARAEQLQVQLEQDRKVREESEVKLRESVQRQHDVMVQKKEVEWNQRFVEERQKLQSMQVTTRAEAQERDRKIKELERVHRETTEAHLKKQQEIMQRLEGEKKQAEASELQSKAELEKLQAQIRELKAQQTTVTKTTSSDADNPYLFIRLHRRPQAGGRSSTTSTSSTTSNTAGMIKLKPRSASAEGAENLILNLGDPMKAVLEEQQRLREGLLEQMTTTEMHMRAEFDAQIKHEHEKSVLLQAQLECEVEHRKSSIQIYHLLLQHKDVESDQKFQNERQRLQSIEVNTETEVQERDDRICKLEREYYAETYDSLCMLMSSPTVRHIADLESHDARHFIELLAKMLDVIDMSHSLHKQCLDMLRKLCGEKQIIPRSFNLSRDAMRNISAKPVASGGFAQVWRGRYGERDVALKVFRYSVLDAGDDAKVFYQEAVFWKWLRHPNITCFHGIDTTSFQGQLAMVCDWMHEGTLATFLICHHNANRLKLILDTAEGLKYLHSMGILHGDLKAVNILINEKHVACLADFGLAALHTGKLASKSLTIGSPRWMSPELLDPEEFGLERAQITPQSDVYALSWVFWEVFTGRFPYAQHKRDPTVIACISRGERHPRPKDAAPLGLSEDLWSLMEVCWSTNWEERPDIGTITKQLQILIQSDGELDEPKEWPLCVQYR